MPPHFPFQFPTIPVGDIELPQEVGKLYELAYNLWWSWTPRAQALFASVDAVAWARYRNPVQLLINVEPTRWERLLESETFMDDYRTVLGAFDRYLTQTEETWFARRYGDDGIGPVAYFSMEYGVHQSLPFYAGGLGVLAGDHLKSASDLGLPLVGVGLLYRHGYFRQTVDADGFQQHTYVEHDFTRLPVRPLAGVGGQDVEVRVSFRTGEVVAKLWTVQVGRIPLVLLDTDVLENDPADRSITSILYVQGREMRLTQEVVLGVGGARALATLGVEPAVWHVNEGHSVLLQVERLRRAVVEEGFDHDEALRRIRASTVFTTHTPVPAGNEQFDRALAGRLIEPLAREARLSVDELLDMGRAHLEETEQPFNLTAMGVRTSGFANAVSKLNAQVCDGMWRHLRPPSSDGEPTIHPITNGVHTATWCGAAVRDLLERHLGRDWQELLLTDAWNKVAEIPDDELWAAHLAQKERLGQFARGRLRDQLARHGRSPAELRAADSWFDPQALTIGFARRFAAYKRAGLLLSDLHRLRRLVSNEGRRVQVIFAGKAHPADRAGQELIQHIVRLTQEPSLFEHVFFLEDYDMRVGAMLVQGADVWLNNPRRLLEASGTSGQKAALNGVLNVSVADGWWPEGYDGENGWVIGRRESYNDDGQQDREDAQALYTLLEDTVVPLFHAREGSAPPPAWVARMRRSIATIGPAFSGQRMVRDYVEQAYAPAARAGRAAGATPA